MSHLSPKSPPSHLLPELAQWNMGSGITIRDWLRCIGTYSHAIGYSTLFWPHFVEYDNCIFLSDVDSAIYNEWMQKCQNNRQMVEAITNHIHILDLFLNDTQVPSEDQVRYLGRLLRDIWQAKAHQDFPQRNIVVVFEEEDIEQLEDYEITLFQAST